MTQAVRHFREVLDSVEYNQEEIVLTRNGKPVAQLVPKTPSQNALEVFGDLCRTLDKKTAKALSSAIITGRKNRR